MALAGIGAYAVFLRCLHLLSPGHYYMISPDSYFFHWLAGRVMAGEGPPADIFQAPNYTLHSGLAYPLTYIANGLSSVSNLSPEQSLDVACKFLPPILGLLTLVLIYFAASRIHNRRVGLFSALAWAIMGLAVLVGAGGYVDRDGLSLLLLTAGVFLFYWAKDYRFFLRNRDVGWVLAAVGVLAVEALLYLEWSFVGPILLVVVLLAYFVAMFFLGYVERLQDEPNALRRLTAAAAGANWRPFALILVANIVVVFANPQQAASWFTFVTYVVQSSGTVAIGEMRGIGIADLVTYYLFPIPIALAIYVALKKRDSGTILYASWFLSLFVLSFFARRVMIYAIPAACLLSGTGLAYLWHWQMRGRIRWLKKTSVVLLLGMMIIFSLTALSFGSNPRAAPDEDWQDALAFLRESTPEEAVVMTWWDYGYWVLDLGERRPVVDNGFYGYDAAKLRDVGLAYATADPSEAARIMGEYDADYLVFSSLEKGIAGPIMSWVEPNEEFDAFPEDSLYRRTLDGEFKSGGGLRVVHRSDSGSKVVVLQLTQAEND